MLIVELLKPVLNLCTDEVRYIPVVLACDLDLLEELVQVSFLIGSQLLSSLLTMLVDVLIICHVRLNLCDLFHVRLHLFKIITNKLIFCVIELF